MKCERKEECDGWLCVDELEECDVGEVFEDYDGDLFMLCIDRCSDVLGVVYLCNCSDEGAEEGTWHDLGCFCNVKCKRVCAKVVIS